MSREPGMCPQRLFTNTKLFMIAGKRNPTRARSSPDLAGGARTRNIHFFIVTIQNYHIYYIKICRGDFNRPSNNIYLSIKYYIDFRILFNFI